MVAVPPPAPDGDRPAAASSPHLPGDLPVCYALCAAGCCTSRLCLAAALYALPKLPVANAVVLRPCFSEVTDKAATLTAPELARLAPLVRVDCYSLD